MHNCIWLLGNSGSGKTTLLKNASIAESQNTTITEDISCVVKFIKSSHHILLAIDFPSLHNHTSENINQILNNLHYPLSLLTQKIKKPIPLTVVITKCDTISGFQDFFSDLTEEEREQCFGYCLDKPFTEQSQLWLQQLQNQLIRRLHYEQNPYKRGRIFEFPFQLSQGHTVLKKIIDNLKENKSISLQGIYFTSCYQPTNHARLSEQKSIGFPIPQHNFFIKGLFSELQTKEAHLHRKNILGWRYILWASFILTLIGSSLFFYGYLQNKEAFGRITSQLIPEQSGLAKLDQLNNTLSSLNTLHLKLAKWLGFGEGEILRNEITTQYHQQLKKILAPFLQKKITDTLKTEIQEGKATLYFSLQTYLMLTGEERFNFSAIAQWLDEQHFPPNLLNHSKQLLPLLTQWPRDNNLIINAKAILQKQSLSETGFLILADSFKQNNTRLDTNNEFFNFDKKISSLYDSSQFQAIYNNRIALIAKRMKGLNESPSLAEEIRELYIQNYLKAWQTFFTEATLTQPNDLKGALNQLHLLSDNNSQLWNTLLSLIDRTIAVIPQKNLDKNNPLLLLKNFIQNKNNFDKLTILLNPTQFYLQTLENAPSILKASYDQAVLRMQNNNDVITRLEQTANQMPEPLNHWLLSFAENSWKVILANSQQFLNTIWQSNIIPFYKTTIENRYPVFNKSVIDINLVDFNRFFGPNGLMQTFFTAFLQPFVNMDNAYWSFKVVDGEKINIPQSTLEMIIRASMIQKMFYTDNPQMPSLKFNLIPENSSDNNLVINIGGQLIQTLHREPSLLSWPAPQGDFIAISFDGTNPDSAHAIKIGPWAWLHFLDDAQLVKSGEKSDHFKLTYSKNNHQTSYTLIADNPINPYESGWLDAFRCPDHL